MRNVQHLPHSPATQPYNQEKQPYSGSYESSLAMNPFSFGQQPVTPTPNYGHSKGVNYNDAAQSLPNPVTPPMQYTGYGISNAASVGGNPFASEEDYFGGPPMGSSVEGVGFQESAMVPSPTNNGNQYQGIVDGVASLSVRPEGPGMTPYWPEAQAQPQPQYQQQQYYPDDLNGNMLPETNAQITDDWGWMNPVQEQAPAPTVQESPQPHASCLPPRPKGDGTKNEQEWSLDDHKSSVDRMRQQGAGLRALRLLDETTVNDLDPYGDMEKEEVAEPKRRSIASSVRKAAKKEMAKSQNAKQIRKLKKLEYKNKKTGMLAESSRTVTSVRRGVDPELTSDKCQLDFDRQRDSQLKALKLLNSNLF